MCKCTPGVRTPYCGKPGCEWPVEELLKDAPSLDEVLEQLKLQGNYSVQLYYGEGTGCDDLDVPKYERNITLLMTPVGYLGSLRVMWVGNLKKLREFDFNSAPKQISNPPERHEYKDHGYYVWGDEQSVNRLIESRTDSEKD